MKPFVRVAVPPPGAALVTDTFRAPVTAVPAIVMLAVICVLLPTVVEFTVMSNPKLTELTPLIKWVPVNTTSSVCSRLPLFGKILANVGAGLFTVTASADDQADSIKVCIAHLAFAVTVKDPPEVHVLEKLVVPTESQPESPPSEKAKRIWTGSPMFELPLAVYVYGVLGDPVVGPVGVETVIFSILTVSATDQADITEVLIASRALALTWKVPPVVQVLVAEVEDCHEENVPSPQSN